MRSGGDDAVIETHNVERLPMRGHQEALPHGIIPYQHSNNRLNEPRIIFILDNLTLNLYPQNQKPPFLRSWPPFLHFEMAPKGDLELNTGIQISILKANSLDG